jgi:hypothetical protein
MIHLYMIFYDDLTAASVPDGFIGLANTNPLRKELFEVEPILKYISQTPIKDDEFYGFFSPRLFDKTGLNRTDITGISQEKLRKFDITSLSPGPIYLSRFNNPISQADIMHGDFTRRFVDLISRIDSQKKLNLKDFSEGHIPQKFFLLSHYIIATGSFWKIWAHYVNLSLEAEANDEKLKTLINTRCEYPGQQGDYTYFVFILERLAGLLAFSNGLKIYDACFTKRCLSDYKNLNPWPRWAIHVAKPLFYLEEKVRSNGATPYASLRALSFLHRKYIWLDRLIVRAMPHR